MPDEIMSSLWQMHSHQLAQYVQHGLRRTPRTPAVLSMAALCVTYNPCTAHVQISSLQEAELLRDAAARTPCTRSPRRPLKDLPAAAASPARLAQLPTRPTTPSMPQASPSASAMTQLSLRREPTIQAVSYPNALGAVGHSGCLAAESIPPTDQATADTPLLERQLAGHKRPRPPSPAPAPVLQSCGSLPPTLPATQLNTPSNSAAPSAARTLGQSDDSWAWRTPDQPCAAPQPGAGSPLHHLLHLERPSRACHPGTHIPRTDEYLLSSWPSSLRSRRRVFALGAPAARTIGQLVVCVLQANLFWEHNWAAWISLWLAHALQLGIAFYVLLPCAPTDMELRASHGFQQDCAARGLQCCILQQRCGTVDVATLAADLDARLCGSAPGLVHALVGEHACLQSASMLGALAKIWKARAQFAGIFSIDSIRPPTLPSEPGMPQQAAELKQAAHVLAASSESCYLSQAQHAPLGQSTQSITLCTQVAACIGAMAGLQSARTLQQQVVGVTDRHSATGPTPAWAMQLAGRCAQALASLDSEAQSLAWHEAPVCWAQDVAAFTASRQGVAAPALVSAGSDVYATIVVDQYSQALSLSGLLETAMQELSSCAALASTDPSWGAACGFSHHAVAKLQHVIFAGRASPIAIAQLAAQHALTAAAPRQEAIVSAAEWAQAGAFVVPTVLDWAASTDKRGKDGALEADLDSMLKAARQPVGWRSFERAAAAWATAPASMSATESRGAVAVRALQQAARRWVESVPDLEAPTLWIVRHLLSACLVLAISTRPPAGRDMSLAASSAAWQACRAVAGAVCSARPSYRLSTVCALVMMCINITSESDWCQYLELTGHLPSCETPA